MKSPKQIFAAVVLCTAVLAAIAFVSTHVFVKGKVYPSCVASLDLHGSNLSVEEYEAICAALPQCEIAWDVPFQGSTYPNDIKHLTLTSLSGEDISRLAFFPLLETIDAAGCRNYEMLMQLRSDHPEIQLHYTVPFGDKEWPEDAVSLTVTSLSDADTAMLAYLPNVAEIDAGDTEDLGVLESISLQYPDITLNYRLTACGETFDRFCRDLSLEQADPAVLIPLLGHMPNLETLTLSQPQGNASDLLILLQTYPTVAITWSRNILGVDVGSGDTEVDLSGTSPESLEQVREEMSWFPNAEQLILCDLNFGNEAMAAFREDQRSEYKVIWNVEVGSLTLRTDDIYYMPGKYNLSVTDEEAYNLRYCEDMICIDVGHKALFNCEWAAFMPNLKYLIIADTLISDISPLEGLDRLIYLEMFLTPVLDLTPLLSCTALEDLNLCYTVADPGSVTQMAWLNNLWWAEPPLLESELREYLPSTNMMFYYVSSTGYGWRELQNYYDMRDILGMHYMRG